MDLIEAVQEGNLEDIIKILSEGADVNQATEDGRTALHFALESWNSSVIKVLLEAGADIDLDMVDEITALRLASEFGKVEVIKELFARGVNLGQAVIDPNITALHIASRFGHDKVIGFLLAIGVDVNQTTKSGRTALHIASQFGEVKAMAELFMGGVNINRMARGKTALHIASKFGEVGAIEALLEIGVDVDQPTAKGKTALHIASKFGKVKAVEKLLAKGADVNCRVNGMTALHIASQFGHDKVIELLLAIGVDANQPTSKAMTALHIASQFGHDKVIKALLARGAHINQPAESRMAALHIASKFGKVEAIKALLIGGADINRMPGGMTALHIASKFGKVKAVEILLAKGADINVNCMLNGKTALHIASQFGHDKVIKALLAKGIDVNQTTTSGKTALHIASQFGKIEAIKALLAKGVDVNRMASGMTALHIASEFGKIEAIKALLAEGVNINQTTASGKTALQIASESKFTQIVNFLIISEAGLDIDLLSRIFETLQKLRIGDYESEMREIIIRDEKTVIHSLLSCGLEIDPLRSYKESKIPELTYEPPKTFIEAQLKSKISQLKLSLFKSMEGDDGLKLKKVQLIGIYLENNPYIAKILKEITKRIATLIDYDDLTNKVISFLGHESKYHFSFLSQTERQLVFLEIRKLINQGERLGKKLVEYKRSLRGPESATEIVTSAETTATEGGAAGAGGPAIDSKELSEDLISAINECDIAKVVNLVITTAYTNQCDEKKLTALDYAMRQEATEENPARKQIVSFLLDCKSTLPYHLRGGGFEATLLCYQKPPRNILELQKESEILMLQTNLLKIMGDDNIQKRAKVNLIAMILKDNLSSLRDIDSSDPTKLRKILPFLSREEIDVVIYEAKIVIYKIDLISHLDREEERALSDSMTTGSLGAGASAGGASAALKPSEALQALQLWKDRAR